jgi:hypothetical protein
LEFPYIFLYISTISKFTEICLVGAAPILAEGQTDGRAGGKAKLEKLIGTFATTLASVQTILLSYFLHKEYELITVYNDCTVICSFAQV